MEGNAANAEKSKEHAVIVSFNYGKTDLADLHSLEDELEAAIHNASAGELDGHEIAIDGSDVTLYMHRVDADVLYSAVEKTIRFNASVKKPKFTLRYGPPKDGTRTVVK